MLSNALRLPSEAEEVVSLYSWELGTTIALIRIDLAVVALGDGGSD